MEVYTQNSLVAFYIETKNLNEDLSFYDGNLFLVHIPHKILKESIVLTNMTPVTLEEQVRNKIETLV